MVLGGRRENGEESRTVQCFHQRPHILLRPTIVVRHDDVESVGEKRRRENEKSSAAHIG